MCQDFAKVEKLQQVPAAQQPTQAFEYCHLQVLQGGCNSSRTLKHLLLVAIQAQVRWELLFLSHKTSTKVQVSSASSSSKESIKKRTIEKLLRFQLRKISMCLTQCLCGDIYTQDAQHLDMEMFEKNRPNPISLALL